MVTIQWRAEINALPPSRYHQKRPAQREVVDEHDN
jgi:hypothetical protein